LSDAAGDTVTSPMTVNVTHGNTADVTVSDVTAFPYCAAAHQAPPCGLTAITFQIVVSAEAPLGNRDVVVTVGSGSTRQTQAYLGAIQIVN
jgi:hypothetical protein